MWRYWCTCFETALRLTALYKDCLPRSLMGVRLPVCLMDLRGGLAMSMRAVRAASKREVRGHDVYTTAQCCEVAA